MKLIIEDHICQDGTHDPNRKTVISAGIRLTLRKRGRIWETRLQLEGRRTHMNLRTGDLKTAARTAIDKARAVVRDDWNMVERGQCRRSPLTLGEVIERYKNQLAPRAKVETLKANVSRLRKLVRLGRGLAKDHPVDGLSVSVLNRDLVQRFQAAYLKDAPASGAEAEAAKRGANSVLADARSLFTKAILADELYPGLPDLSGFLNARRLPAMPVTFRYEAIDEWVERVFAALPKLKKQDPGAYLYFRLAAVLGLRRMEALEARKGWVTTRRGHRVLYVQPTDGWVPKGRRERKVPLPEDLYAELLTLGDDSDYLVPIARRAKHHCTNKSTDRRLNKWLNDLGWPFEKKGHELRRWFGAQVATQTGSLFTAQRMLGHASPATTNQYYADLVDVPDYRITTETTNVPHKGAGSPVNISC